MLLAALRRLAALVVLGAVVTAIVSLPLGLLFGASAERALTIGFYLTGCFLMVVGFFAGNRGPARVKSESPGRAVLPFTFSGRRLRWASDPGTTALNWLTRLIRKLSSELKVY